MTRPSPGLRYSPGSSESDRAAKANAWEFARLVGRVVNTALSKAPITFAELEGDDPLGYIAHTAGKLNPAPFRLSNGHYFYMFQKLGLRREERYLTTLEYRYIYQADETNDSWIFRYEYQREPAAGYRYPLSHLHVNATPDAYAGEKPFPELHLPCERVTIESVARHLVTEHGVDPISPNWEEELAASEAAFEEIQRNRVLDPPTE